MTKIIRTIAALERMPSSANGNPRYLVKFTDGDSAPLEPDSSIGYSIPNPEFKGVSVVFTLNGRGHITHAQPASVDIRPMHESELGGYVCVSGCLLSPRITVDSDGVWVKDMRTPGGTVSSAHRQCAEAMYLEADR